MVLFTAAGKLSEALPSIAWLLSTAIQQCQGQLSLGYDGFGCTLCWLTRLDSRGLRGQHWHAMYQTAVCRAGCSYWELRRDLSMLVLGVSAERVCEKACMGSIEVCYEREPRARPTRALLAYHLLLTGWLAS